MSSRPGHARTEGVHAQPRHGYTCSSRGRVFRVTRTLTNIGNRTIRTIRTIRVAREAGSAHRRAHMTAMSTVSAHRRPLATAAGVLFALGFVPSAQASSATERGPGSEVRSAAAVSAEAVSAEAVRAAADPGAVAGPRLNPDAGFDSAPYLLGATGLAGAGGLLTARARHVRRAAHR